MSEYKLHVIEKNRKRETVDTWESVSYKSLNSIRAYGYTIAESLNTISRIQVLRDGKIIGLIKNGMDRIYYTSYLKNTVSELMHDGTLNTIN